MQKIEIKIGDKFIYVSKYGGIIKDIIVDMSVVTEINFGAYILKYKIKSSNGIWYEFDEINICSKFIEPI